MRIQSARFDAVWPQIKLLLSDGYSIIPVREIQEGDYVPKSPYTGWKKYQLERITEPELWHLMAEKFNTTAVAVLCGKISGNLELIDIDNKNKPGIESEVFTSIEKLFPDLWSKLRIHKSPSGGFHIWYRCIDLVPGSKKLASTELKKAFLETRGEGGYGLMPPSMGYQVVHDNPIPTVTWTERCALINICLGFDELPKPIERIQERKPDEYYDVNPFEDFNRSAGASGVLEANGWKYKDQNSKFIWFSRPGGSDNIHAAFLKEKRLYYFFTTNSLFDAERSYQPATVLSQLEHGGDKKKTYIELVNRGFGKIKSSVEARIISKGGESPKNLSTPAAEALAARKLEIAAKYPLGTFWTLDEDGITTIEREPLYRVARGLGFRFDEVMQSLVFISNNRIKRINDRFFYDSIKRYIGPGDEVLNAYEAFVQRAGNFSIGRIETLDENLILNDNRNNCFKFYKDVFVQITKDGYSEHLYSELGDYIIWEDQIQNRKLRIGDSGKFVDFLEKAIEYNKYEKYMMQIIGYLSHNWKDETTPYIIVLVEQCEDPANGGGSGKNVFSSLFKYTTTIKNTPGSQIKYDEKVLQNWDGERLFVISDVDKDFKYIFFKELSSGSGKIKKLWKNEATVPMEKMPKFLIQSNYAVEIKDGGLKRRILQIEFTDFFTNAKGLDTYYGSHFPLGWNEEDWAGYDGTIIRSVQEWIKFKKIEHIDLTETGWRKKLENDWGKTCVEIIKEYWSEWISLKEVSNDLFKKQLLDFYDEKGIGKTYQPTSFKINKAIETYAKYHGFRYFSDVKKTENGIQYKCRAFISSKDVAPF